jgi:FMN-dependent NADH-azoreductase
MTNILFLKSSLNGEQGNSTQLARELLVKLTAKIPVTLVERDLSSEPLSHLTQQEMSTWMIPAAQCSAEQQKLANISNQLIDELKASDIIVVAMPMYNFGVPSTFKAWIDRIARAGITFKYTEQGPVGLLAEKKVIVVAARGGIYAGTSKDTQTAYLRDVFAFIGLTDIEFIYAEGLNMPTKEQSLTAARESILRVTEEVLTTR